MLAALRMDRPGHRLSMGRAHHRRGVFLLHGKICGAVQNDPDRL